jgi:hypothetical protein
MNRKGYGFEKKKEFFMEAVEKVIPYSTPSLFCEREVKKYKEPENLNLFKEEKEEKIITI